MPPQTSTDPLPSHPVVENWRFSLGNLRGWNESQIVAFAERWRGDILGHGLFYHEEPEYWITHQMLPDSLLRLADAHPRVPLYVRASGIILATLLNYRRTHGLSPHGLQSLGQELAAAIQKCVTDETGERPHK